MIKKRLLTAFFLSLLCCFPLANSAFAANLGDAFGVRNGSATDPLDTAASAANYKIGVANTEITPFFSKVISFG
jgi:hypothetical protein